MTEPVVCAIMLTRDRPELAARAIERFRAQTYQRKQLLILDSGRGFDFKNVADAKRTWIDPQLYGTEARFVGGLRNIAIRESIQRFDPIPDVFVHWDDDDWSHEWRLQIQVQQLMNSQVDCVGFREILFWREERKFEQSPTESTVHPGQAWLYRNTDRRYAVGTSLCYWRAAWEHVKFEHLPIARGGTGEDTTWLKRVSCYGHPCEALVDGLTEPMMIARIHSGNTQDYGDDLLNESSSWTRRPEWDQACREYMELA